MKTLGYLMLLLQISACKPLAESSPASQQSSPSQQTPLDVFSVDANTREQLYILHHTVENFTLLNSRKYENIAAYHQFADLLEMQLATILKDEKLSQPAGENITRYLRDIQQQIGVLRGENMIKCKESIALINKDLQALDTNTSNIGK